MCVLRIVRVMPILYVFVVVGVASGSSVVRGSTDNVSGMCVLLRFARFSFIGSSGVCLCFFCLCFFFFICLVRIVHSGDAGSGSCLCSTDDQYVRCACVCIVY